METLGSTVGCVRNWLGRGLVKQDEMGRLLRGRRADPASLAEGVEKCRVAPGARRHAGKQPGMKGAAVPLREQLVLALFWI